MLGGRSALLGAAGGGNPYGNWTGNYSDVSLLLRNDTPKLIPLDESPSPKTVTALGSAQNTTAVVKYGTSSMVFDGSNSVISTPYNTAFNLAGLDYTIEMWLRQTSAGGYQVPLVYSDFSNAGLPQGWRLHTDNGSVYLYFNSATRLQSSTGLTLNTWQHLAICRSGSTTRMFLDGVQVGSTTSATFTDPSSSATLRIGAFAFPGYYFPFNGYIDDLRITKGVARYTANFTAPTAELPANITDDPSYNSVSLLLRNGTPTTVLIPLDESPSPKTVTALGSAQNTTAVVKYGTSSMVFDGVNSYLTVPDVIELEFGSSNLTLEMWVKTASSAQNATLIGRMPSAFTQGTWGLPMNVTSSTAGDLALYVADYSQSGPLLLTSGVNVRDNEWHHIAIVRNGSAWNLYVDGISRATQTWAGTITDITGSIYIGRDQYYVRYFSGYIDDLRITKGVARYAKNFLPPPAELPAI